IARVLGAGTRGENCLTGAGYTVTWALGHLVTLKEPQELDERYARWRAEDLPILPERMETKVIPKTKSQFAAVKKLMNDRETGEIICATDSGREGELIFRYIYEQAGCQKPVKRLWISSMTDEAIRAGFDSLLPASEYDALYHSARCRADADWLIGMNATRAYTLRYGVLLSVGRVQTPTLSMLVRRRREIDTFVPKTFYTVRADFGDYEGTYIDEKGEKRIDDEQEARAIAERVRGKSARVESATRERKAERPPLLYDLTTLQREANMQFGFTAKKTLATAQKLYEQHKLLTYPRTDSRYLSRDMLGKVKSTLERYGGELAAIGQRALEQGVRLTPRVFDDAKLTDHHAIIPTGRRAQGLSLTADERKLYELVARRLAAAFYPNYEYDALRAVTVVATPEGENRFLSTGKAVVQMGWREIVRPEAAKRRKKEDDEQTLPALSPGETRTCKGAQAKEEQTKPPKEHTDASLLAEMEHAGRQIEDEELREQMKDCALGTPATRAAIIERLIEVGYVRRSGKNLLATPKGMRLIEAVPPEIASPETTGRWERALSQIAKGNGGEERFREGIARLAAFLVGHAAKAPDVPFEKEERRAKGRGPKTLGIACPLCAKGKIAENSKSFYCTRFREGCAFTVWKDALVRAGGPPLTAKLFALCAKSGDVRGSTGTIHYDNGRVSFTPLGGRAPEKER
ncbi:MAG: DNA topoisomerase 3, partial [Clostridia bacterium]|nr:DNA topoisomerase 3 [Clostridia bacterium]